jgi:nitrogen fixation protein NifQ
VLAAGPLWRDLGLSGRDEVTDILTRYFPALVARNVDEMRWEDSLRENSRCRLD